MVKVVLIPPTEYRAAKLAAKLSKNFH